MRAENYNDNNGENRGKKGSKGGEEACVSFSPASLLPSGSNVQGVRARACAAAVTAGAAVTSFAAACCSRRSSLS